MNPETNSKAWVPTRWYKLVRDSPSLSWRAKSAAAVLASYMDNRSGTCTPSLGTSLPAWAAPRRLRSEEPGN